MPKRVVVTLHADGTIRAESTGRQGPACIDDIALIASMLPGARIAESLLTDEYHQPAQVHAEANEYLPTQNVEGYA